MVQDKWNPANCWKIHCVFFQNRSYGTEFSLIPSFSAKTKTFRSAFQRDERRINADDLEITSDLQTVQTRLSRRSSMDRD